MRAVSFRGAGDWCCFHCCHSAAAPQQQAFLTIELKKRRFFPQNKPRIRVHAFSAVGGSLDMKSAVFACACTFKSTTLHNEL